MKFLAALSVLCSMAVIRVVFPGFVVAGPGQSQSAGSAGNWSTKASLPTAHLDAAVYYHGLLLYAGGECKRPDPQGGGDTFSENEAYDPKTNRWVTLAPLPAGRQ